MPKPKLHAHIEQSRASQAPKKGAKVSYPVPFPPVAHNTKGGKTIEVAVPTGDEQWFPATVKTVEHHAYTVSPDDHVAVLETEDGRTLAISVVLLRPA